MEKILIVDDEIITLSYLEEILEKHHYIVAGKATTGKEAIEFTKINRPDIILMDINMPGEMNGIEAGKKIYELYQIPIIFITAYSSEKYVKQIESLGPFGYIVKPFNEIQIKATIFIALYRDKMEKNLNKLVQRQKKHIIIEKFVSHFVSEINKIGFEKEDLHQLLKKTVEFFNINGLIIYYKDDVKENILKNKHLIFNNQKELALDEINLDDFSEDIRKEVMRVNIIRNFKKFPENIEKFCERNSIHSCLNIPLMVNETYFGNVVYFFGKNNYKENIRYFLNIITNSISINYKKINDFYKIKEIEQEKYKKEKLLMQSERLASFGALTSSIAHEISQPLQSIKVLTESALFWEEENKPLNYEKLIEYIAKISDRVDLITNIIKNMKSVFQSTQNIKFEQLNVNDVINEIIKLLEEKINSSNISIVKKLKNGITPITLSQVQIQQVIYNIIINAIRILTKEKKDKKIIEIETNEDEKYVIIIISDNGPGISEKEKQRIFEPFYSKDTHSDGMGMGLYIVHNILKSMNSNILVKESSMRGAQFEIKIKNKNSLDN